MDPEKPRSGGLICGESPKATIEDGRDTKESPIAKHRYGRGVAGTAGTIDLIDIEKNPKNGSSEQRKLVAYITSSTIS